MPQIHTPQASPCVATVIDFFYFLDMRQHADAAALMAEQGTWTRGEELLRGPGEVLSALEQRPLNRTTCHVVTNLRVAHLSECSATIRFYMSAYVGVAGEEEMRLVSLRRCTDELVLADGAWKIGKKTSAQMLP
ncbi:nuclear transport factor 2 family protein [Cupriavidus lacunae]|uniref:Nuclear transport factor 2 family protein n=1 Tax=Cupriavidus lacunae TaxID=2666307 RepID=A0A370NR95_9BURK|nr:nuclear transport factor 2 family protein [Cupriavidus lacunae]RDK08115.1 nuclear transport factor 2 family protein [Cupriavidus lacunae]